MYLDSEALIVGSCFYLWTRMLSPHTLVASHIEQHCRSLLNTSINHLASRMQYSAEDVVVACCPYSYYQLLFHKDLNSPSPVRPCCAASSTCNPSHSTSTFNPPRRCSIWYYSPSALSVISPGITIEVHSKQHVIDCKLSSSHAVPQYRSQSPAPWNKGEHISHTFWLADSVTYTSSPRSSTTIPPPPMTIPSRPSAITSPWTGRTIFLCTQAH